MLSEHHILQDLHLVSLLYCIWVFFDKGCYNLVGSVSQAHKKLKIEVLLCYILGNISKVLFLGFKIRLLVIHSVKVK